MGSLRQLELVQQVDTLCKREVFNQGQVVRLRGKEILLGEYKGSFMRRCAQWIKRTFGRSKLSYKEYLDSVTSRESDALAKALAKELSRRTVKPCTLSGKVTLATLSQTIEGYRKELKEFDSIVKQVVRPALKGDTLTSDPLDGSKTVLRTALMDRKIARPEQLHELRSVFSRELEELSGKEDEKRLAIRTSLTKRMGLAIEDLTLTMELFREALDYVDRQQLTAGLEEKRENETTDRPGDYVYIEDTPDSSTDNDGMIIKLAKKTIDRPEGFDASAESVSGRIDDTLVMLEQKYPNIQPVHLRTVRDYLESHFSSSPATPQAISEPSTEFTAVDKERPSSIIRSKSRDSLTAENLDEEEDNDSVFSFTNEPTSPVPVSLTTPDTLPEESLNVAGPYTRLSSEAGSGASNNVVSDYSRQGSVDDEQDLSGMDLNQYKSLPGSEPENLKAGRDRLGNNDSGFGLNNGQDTPS